MPKVAQISINKINANICKFPGEFIRTPSNELFCNICSTVVNHVKQFFVEAHRNTAKHVRGIIQSSSNSQTQLFLQPAFKSDFTKDVLKAFLSADIPLRKLRNKNLKKLFASIGHPLPAEQTCRMKVTELYEEEIERIKALIKDEPVFIIVDESDISGKKYVNILVGIISKPHISYLVECAPLSTAANSEILLRLIDDTINFLSISRPNFNLLLTDAASYMLSTGRTLHKLYPHLFHVTCIAHLIHNCAMRIRAHFVDVDQLIARIKNAVIKNKTRANTFNEIGIPPETIVTRWASWLIAAMYYSANFPVVQGIVRKWSGDGVLVRQAKEIIEKPGIVQALIAIERSYRNLINIIFKLECKSCGIMETMRCINELQFNEDPCAIGIYLKGRLEKNEIIHILECTRTEISPHLYSLLQNCQSTSAAVERSFSLLKKMLTKERNFNCENVRKYVIIYFNSSVNNEQDIF